MALIHFDGFDHYDDPASGNYIESTIAGTIYQPLVNSRCKIATMPVLGSAGFQGEENGGGFRYALPASKNTGKIGVGCHVVMAASTPSSGKMLLGLTSGTTARYSIVNASGATTWAFRNGSNTSATTFILAPSTLYHIEMLLTFGNPGTVEIRVNGVTVFLDSAQNLSNSIDSVQIGPQSGGSSGPSRLYSFDNLFIYDETGTTHNDFLGDRTVFTLFPSADTADADWVLSSGTDGFDLINDVPANGATNYISADTIGYVSKFELDDLADASVGISAVRATGLFSKEDSGVALVQIGLDKSGGTETYSPDFSPSLGDWTFASVISEENPDTGEAWTAADVNALRIAIKRSG